MMVYLISLNLYTIENVGCGEYAILTAFMLV